MSVEQSNTNGNPTSTTNTPQSPEQLAEQLQQLGDQLRAGVREAAKQGQSFDQTERSVQETLRKIGCQAMQFFISMQGNGDLGDEVATDSGRVLKRSEHTSTTHIRSIFGMHTFDEFTYALGTNKAIQLRPVSARMQLPPTRWSFLLQEISQAFCAEAAFNQAADHLELVLGGKFSVDTMEQVNLSMGVDAGEFLDQLPQPDPQKEAEFLVATADCKGVPLLKKDAAKVKAFQTAKKRPGNRRMATVTSLYSVDPYHRTAEDLLAALFREQPTELDASTDSTARPEPKFKHTTAHFPTVAIDGEDDEEIQISGIHQGLGWLNSEVQSRRAKDQKLIVLMDGQEASWDTSAMHFCDEQTVEILDFLHVAVYVWAAAALFHQSSEMKEAFTYDRLARLLAGDVKGVIRGLRRMGSLHKLTGEYAEDCARITGYLEKHAARMKYDEYLAMGYPICSGVIEGACRHLVKDRMERSGMRWSLEGARSMLHVRAAYQSDYWNQFHDERKARIMDRTHTNRSLIAPHRPPALGC
ncbi:ISKra4 family transposase [Allorhodopirellula solitaria]|uniref:ISKra4 family transposase n=1 Tax=Allorhodopirellula solitaria TaxID=2527987 RepID=A0A5C5X1Z1_9BACT|nr:ISKra4 family transposase [Allorhodopirellula solitaria]TWT56271.1 hypothetical protein CA85_44530 [Allorhodopirellula solitaria]